MGRLVLSSVCLMAVILLSVRCGDRDGQAPVTSYYVKAKFDGQLREFNRNTFADKIETSGVIGKLDVTGYQSDDLLSPSLDFEIWSQGGAPVGTGTYAEPANNILCRYSTQTSNGTIVYGSQQNANDMVIVVTELTSKYAKGAFQGTLTINGGTQSIKLTEGVFYVPFQ